MKGIFFFNEEWSASRHLLASEVRFYSHLVWPMYYFFFYYTHNIYRSRTQLPADTRFMLRIELKATPDP